MSEIETRTSTEDAGGTDPHGAPGPQPRGNALQLVLLIGGIVLLAVLQGFVPVIVVIAAIIVMVFFHELGHYLTAKWAGMKVTEFFIGFGPKLWSFRRGETEYGFKAIPAGAYVRIIGMHNLEDVDPADEGRTYRQKPYWRRLSVGLAGSAMHFVMALVLLFTLFVGWGLPQHDSDRWTVSAVSADSAAERAGLREGDRLLAVDGRTVGAFENLRGLVEPRAGEEVTLQVERDGRLLELETRLGSREVEGRQVGFLGVGPRAPLKRDNPLQAAGRSVTEFGHLSWESGKALVSFFTPGSLGDYAGNVTDGGGGGRVTSPGSELEDEGNRFLSPVGAVRIGAQATETGLQGLIGFLVVINIFVGIFNLVPLLPLDGGHVVIATYEKIRSMIKGERYFVDVAKWLPVTYAVVMVLAVIGISALYLDVTDPIDIP